MLTLLQDSNNNKQWKSERIALLAHVAPSTAQTRHRYKHGLDDVLDVLLVSFEIIRRKLWVLGPARLSKIASDTGCALLVFCVRLSSSLGELRQHERFRWIIVAAKNRLYFSKHDAR